MLLGANLHFFFNTDAVFDMVYIEYIESQQYVLFGISMLL